MAVKIRLKKMGAKKRPFYRIVAADERCPRDGRFIEIIGYYNPLTDPADIKVDEDKLYKWLDNGAKPTDNTKDVLKQLHLIEKWQLLKSGVPIAQIDATIAERRAKQPKPKEKVKGKLSKKAVAAAKVAEEAKVKEAEEAAKAIEEAAKAEEEEKTKAAEGAADETTPDAGENTEGAGEAETPSGE
ncbi:MAG: 30S ribosomal protein S16 [Bacteroidales bacterium]|nr:30S ribosomal protein S16 [Candidatus Latescibacterota bacterium]